MWLHENDCCKGAVACLYQEGGRTGMTFCHQTGEPITRWAYNRDFPVYGEVPPESGTFFLLEVHKRVGILQVEV